MLTGKARSTTHIQIEASCQACAQAANCHLSAQQSHQETLVPFASLSAISGTFNSLSKVLFIFPSWYLFAIGLKPIFSFRWNLPPLALQARGTWLLESTPYTEDCRWQTGLSPSLMLFSKRLTSAPPLAAHLKTTIQGQRPQFPCWAYPCSFAITKGILFSFLSSAYLYA